MRYIHGTTVNECRYTDGDWTAKVEVFASGRAYECVECCGINKHESWFDAALLGRAQHYKAALADYTKALLGTIAAESD